MADTLESLEIEVKHSASGAAEEIKQVSTAISGLSRALKKVLPRLEMFRELMGGTTVNYTDNGTTQIANTINNVGQASAKAGKATREASKGVRELTKQASKSKGPLETIVASLKRIAFYRIIRSIIKSIGKAFAEGLEKAYLFSSMMANESHRFAEAMDGIKSSGNAMKAQLGSAFISLLTALQPVIISLINLITRVADALSQLFAAFTGTRYLKATLAPAKWAEAANSATKAAKEWKNQLLGFDEINRLEEPSNGGGSGTNPLEGYSMQDAEINPKIVQIVKAIKDNITDLQIFANGALLGLGLILTFTGANIPLGLGLIVAGAIGLAKIASERWGWITANVARELGTLDTLGNGFKLGIGLALLLSGGSIPLGIGLVASGAIGLANRVAENWGIIPERVRKTLIDLEGIVGAAELAVGAILLFATPQFSAVGLALVADGLFNVVKAAINWNKTGDDLQSTLNRVAGIAGGALIGIGAVLAFTGANIPGGIGMMVAGGIMAGASVALNYDRLPNNIRKIVRDILEIVSDALLVIGTILTFTGNLSLGIPLLAAGAIGLVAANANESSSITELIGNVIADILLIGGTLMFAAGIILLFTGNIPLGLALLVGGLTAMGIGGLAGASNPLFELVDGCLSAIYLAFTNWINNLIAAVSEAVATLDTWFEGHLGFKLFGGEKPGDSSGHRGLISSIPGGADGGFVYGSGQLFVAREAGPEMVGTIGGQTAIANNDQIVESIRAGVYEAVSSAMNGNGNGDVNLKIYLDSREIKAGFQRLDRAWGA